MNAHATIEAENQDSIALVLNPETMALVLTDAARFEHFYERVKTETGKLEPDVSTKKGRDEIRSMARKVTQTKTALDAHRKVLTEQWRQKTNAVNKVGGEIWDRLEALAADVRKPLTDWEEAEKAREAACNDAIAQLSAAMIIHAGETSDHLAERLTQVEGILIEEAVFQDLAPGAIYTRTQAIEILTAGLERARKEEADRAELERLREAERARLAAEAAAQAEQERIAREAAEEAAQAERDRLQKQAIAQAAEDARIAEAARVERAHQAALEQAERDREVERKRIEDAHAAEVARVQKAAADAQAERDRLERERLAEEKRVADAAAARARDIEHRSAVMGAAKVALMERAFLSEDDARAVVRAVVAGLIPNMTMEF